MSKIKNENYFAVKGWMINELQLCGNELLIYAIIYCFSQDEHSVFMGTAGYLSEWISSSKQTVFKTLKNLCDKGLIERVDKNINGVTLVDYRIKKFTIGSQKNLPGVVEKFDPPQSKNLTPYIYIDNNKENKEREKEKKTLENFPKFHDDEFMNLFEQVINTDNFINKTQQQLEFELRELKSYDMDYAKELIKHTLKTNNKQITYPNTKIDYLNWKKRKEKNNTQSQIQESFFIPRYNKS